MVDKAGETVPHFQEDALDDWTGFFISNICERMYEDFILSLVGTNLPVESSEVSVTVFNAIGMLLK